MDGELNWLLEQGVEVFSWTGIGWFVALLLGLWGAMIGLGAFLAAYIFLALSLVLCTIKWMHVTNIFKRERRTISFFLGLLALLIVMIGTAIWTHRRKIQSDEDAKKLEPLNSIPQMAQQLKDMPQLRQTITDLQKANQAETKKVQDKEALIEGLSQTVVTQQKVIAIEAHTDLQNTQKAITTDIDRYRTDTTSAVGKLLRPGRTLGDKRAALVASLKAAGPHTFAITSARGNSEAMEFASEIESAFKEAKWTEVPTQVAFITKDGTGLEIWIHDWTTTPLNPAQLAVGAAFNSIGMQLTGIEAAIIKADGPADIYVGLQ